jgi:hypothetical protein
MPAEVLERLLNLDLPVHWVRGNADREVLECMRREALAPDLTARGWPGGR